jgi:sphinganine-1-phosphate aldolase
MTRPDLPQIGAQWPALHHTLMSSRANDLAWEQGAFYYHWPEPGGNVHQAAMAAGNMFYADIWLGRFNQPSINTFIEDLEGFVLNLHEGSERGAVVLTSGGTESILLAMKAARDRARSLGVTASRPQIVAPWSAHPAFNKAADYFDLEVIRVPVGDDLKADVSAMAEAITPETIALIGSAPSWPYGLIDPIPAIAALAKEHGLWCHVDACVGGFLIPFYRELGHDLTPMNFTVSGVTSISADLHKFGFTPHGISSVSFCDEEAAAHAAFSFDAWPCGRFAIETVQGTKPGHTAAAAWTTMRLLGRNGYLDLARRLARTTEKLVEGATALGLKPLAKPEAGILTLTSDAVDIFAVSEALNRRGFPHCAVLQPEALHYVINPVENDEPIHALLEAIAGAVEDAKASRITRAGRQSTYA